METMQRLHETERDPFLQRFSTDSYDANGIPLSFEALCIGVEYSGKVLSTPHIFKRNYLSPRGSGGLCPSCEGNIHIIKKYEKGDF